MCTTKIEAFGHLTHESQQSLGVCPKTICLEAKGENRGKVTSESTVGSPSLEFLSEKMCSYQCKGSTFSSVSSRLWVLIRPAIEPGCTNLTSGKQLS